jgi:hypothetical protein
MDNCCAVHAVNQFGSSKSIELNDIAKAFWHTAILKNVFLKASYIPGKENWEADWASRFFEDSSDWMLHRDIFTELDQIFGPFQVDLFASHLNAQVTKFYSWFPDPQAYAVDAFSQCWEGDGLYAFPPFNMIQRVIHKISLQKSTLLLIAPCWPQQVWFDFLLKVTWSTPILLPTDIGVLRNPRDQVHPLLANHHLHLVAWPITGSREKVWNFQQQLPTLSMVLSETQQGSPTSRVGTDGWLGTINGRVILARHL